MTTCAACQQFDGGEYITNALCEHINNRNSQVKVQHGATNRPTYNIKQFVYYVYRRRCIVYIELAKPAVADDDDVMFWAEFYRFYRNTHFKCSTKLTPSELTLTYES